MSTKPERMLVRCPWPQCNSGLLDIGVFDDLEKMKFKPFTLQCAEGHKNEYRAYDVMRESKWSEEITRKPYVNRHVEFRVEQEKYR